MDKQTTGDKVKKLIADHLDAELEKVTDNSDIIDDLGADSLDVVEVVMLLEEEFNIEIADNEAEKWKNVGDVVDYVHNKQA